MATTATSNAKPGKYIGKLSDDVIILILHEVRKLDSLRGVSETCRYLRRVTLPLMFINCHGTVDQPIRKRFLPRTLWPHVISLRIRDECHNKSWFNQSEDENDDTDDEEDLQTCRLYDSTFFQEALDNMPKLRSVDFYAYDPQIHGLPWNVIHAILSKPEIQQLRVHNLLISPNGDPAEVAGFESPAALTTFEYMVSSSRTPGTLSERTTVDAILRASANSLEKLLLPDENHLTYSAFPVVQWPRLQELTIRGQHTASPSLPLLSAFATMPSIRVLKLELQVLARHTAPMLSPLGDDMDNSLQNLEHLTLTHPHPNDEIFARLRPGLRSLAVHSWPHYYQARWGFSRFFKPRPSPSPPPLVSFRLLTSLVQCNLRNLVKLHVEYIVDDYEIDLLECILSNFPALVELDLHRFWTQNEEDPPVSTEDVLESVGEIGELLESHLNLRTIRAHFDFPDTPQRGEDDYYDQEEVDTFVQGTLTKAATSLACTVGSSVERLYLLYPQLLKAEWAVFRLGGEGAQEAEAGERECVFIGREVVKYTTNFYKEWHR